MKLPSIETILFDHLVKQREAEERQPSLLAGKLHANASSAGACARQIGFRVAGTEASNPITGDALFNFSLGDHVHDQIQSAFLAVVPDTEIEVSGVIEDFITARADLKYPTADGKIVCGEIKSVSDFAFKLITGKKLKSNGQWNKKDQKAEGCKPEHVLQVGISAKAIGAEFLHIIYARKTAAKDEPILAEYRFRLNDLSDLIENEIGRLRAIVNFVERGELPPREYEGKTIVDPKGTRWPCQYCGWLSKCAELKSGAVPLPK